MDKTTKYKHRFLARVIIEAVSPLSVGSGSKHVMTDHLIVRDANGFPYIPGTAIAGILRHAIGEELAKPFFGTDEGNGKGSEIMFSSACLVADSNKIIEGIFEEKNSEYMKLFQTQLIRQHVKLNDKGTTDTGGKFDGEVVYKGTRFCFEIEMVSEGNDKNINLFEAVLKKLASNSFRIGSGTRSGYGEIKIVECKIKYLDLEKDLDIYINKSSSLTDEFWEDKSLDIKDIANDLKASSENTNLIEYKLTLKPDDFFFFGSGFGNEKADMTALTETKIIWDGNNPKLVTNNILIPGSSVKGALSHRTAYHYNKNNCLYVGNDEAKSGNENPAVRELFGYADEEKSDNPSVRGKVLISDIIEHIATETKILNHVSIDRFTGGAIEGALFSEEVIYSEKEFDLNIYVDLVEDITCEADIKTPLKAFECALIDVVNGMLPLGGGVNRGHGCFTGKVLKNGNKIYENE